jgi:hypothetical protein
MHGDSPASPSCPRAVDAASIEGALHKLSLSTPAPPPLAALRTGIQTSISREGNKVNFINVFQGRPWPVRLAAVLGALALLFALSLLLPFAGGLQHAPRVSAYSGGYVLIFDFGTVQPTEEMHAAGMAVVQQWKEANGITPDLGLSISGGEDVVDGHVTFTLGLIGATLEQANDLVERLKAVPGVPVPQVVEAQWYQVEAAEAEKRGEALLYEFDHAFIFSRGTTGEQMEQAMRDYLIETRGTCDFDIEVCVEWTDKGHSINVMVSPLDGKGKASGSVNHLDHAGGH